MDYHFKPLGKTCAISGQPLVPGSLCYSVLVDRDGEPQRLDIAEPQWQGPPADAIGYWRLRAPLPPDPNLLKIDPAALLAYFEQMYEEQSPAKERQRYVAAMLLLQKRRLRLEGSTYDEHVEYLELVGQRGEGAFRVPHLDLTEDELMQVQAEIRVALATEWQV